MIWWRIEWVVAGQSKHTELRAVMFEQQKSACSDFSSQLRTVDHDGKVTPHVGY